MIIEGAISIKSAIINQKRKVDVVYIDNSKKTKDFNYLRNLCKKNNIEIKELKRVELDKMTSSKTYGGILAEVSLKESDKLSDDDIFLIDGIEDPFNLGYIMRSLYALGVKNIIIPKKDYESSEAQILKSSAGAYDYLNVFYSSNLEDDVLKLKGYYLYGLKRCDDAKDIFEVDFKKKALFLIGGEKRGLSKALEDMCNEFLYIPYGNDFRNALNAASATIVVGTLLFSKRK